MTKFDSHKWIREFKEGKINEEQPMKAFAPGDMWSNDFDYIGMLRYSVALEIPQDLSRLVAPEFVQLLKDLFESYTDVNYHSEAQDLGNAIDWIEDGMKKLGPQARMELERAQDFLESHQKAADKTLKDLTRGK